MSFDDLKQAASRLSRIPYSASPQVSTNWSNLSYVDYTAIRFRSGHALWGLQQLPFRIEFMHPGYVHRDTIELHEVVNDQTHRIPFSTSLFKYEPLQIDSGTVSNFAGFKIVSANPEPREVGAFIGASYFRFVGYSQAYGLSARGLALNVTSSEEFPTFRSFWLRRPEPTDQDLVVLALLDSTQVVGAFEFRVLPGSNTTTWVRAFLQPRLPLKDPGFAPLTSMFLHDDNGRIPYRDFRPEVHDSDGLLLHTGGNRWIWRPLDQGKMIRINTYADRDPQGFGLMQRDRDFTHYEDPVAQFERRPSAWIRPLGNWGKGAVTLVQLPSDREFSDNVVLYWRPDDRVDPIHPCEYAYVIEWTTNRIVPQPLAIVTASRVGAVIVEPSVALPNLRFVIDFAGGELHEASAPTSQVTVASGARKVAESLYFVKETGVWRLVVEITPPSKAIDLQGTLYSDRKEASETWAFTWQP